MAYNDPIDVNCSDNAVAITPSDETVLNPMPRALYVGTTGNVNVKTARGNDVVYSNVPVGSYILTRVQKVYATSTTASNIVGQE